MDRLTEYHCGVAVIKDKQRIAEALHKLAVYEDLEESDKRVQECIAELRQHRDSYLKKSTSWRTINRAINLLIGLGAEVAALRKTDHSGEVNKMVETNADINRSGCKNKDWAIGKW